MNEYSRITMHLSSLLCDLPKETVSIKY